MGLALTPLLSYPTQTHAPLSGGSPPPPPLPLSPGPPGWDHHLAHPVYHVSRGVHRASALRLALSPDAPGGGPGCAVGDAWGAEFGAVCGPLPYLPHGALPPRLCVRPPQSGDGLNAVWTRSARLFPGG